MMDIKHSIAMEGSTTSSTSGSGSVGNNNVNTTGSLNHSKSAPVTSPYSHAYYTQVQQNMISAYEARQQLQIQQQYHMLQFQQQQAAQQQAMMQAQMSAEQELSSLFPQDTQYFTMNSELNPQMVQEHQLHQVSHHPTAHYYHFPAHYPHTVYYAQDPQAEHQNPSAFHEYFYGAEDPQNVELAPLALNSGAAVISPPLSEYAASLHVHGPKQRGLDFVASSHSKSASQPENGFISPQLVSPVESHATSSRQFPAVIQAQQRPSASFKWSKKGSRKSPKASTPKTHTTGDKYSSPPGPIPAAVPEISIDSVSGEEVLTFSYSKKKVVTKFSLRCPKIDFNKDLDYDLDFLNANCIYPGAMCPPEEYQGRRGNYERECNFIGWELAYLNPEIRNRRGLIQRAVDSWRNTRKDAKIRSRRVRRETRAMTRTVGI